MTKHEGNTKTASTSSAKTASSEESSEGTLHKNSQIKKQGEVYKGKKTYFIKGTDIGREDQKSNERMKNGTTVYPTKDLKNNTNDKNGQGNNTFRSRVKKFCKNLETLKKTNK